MTKTPKSIILTEKQIDIIQKFIRLANSNPNEHEANSAARKVCKMLEGYIFPLNNTQIPPGQGSNPFDDIFRARAQQNKYQEQWDREAAYQKHYESGYNKGRNEPGRPPPGSDRYTKRGRTENEPPRGEDDPFKQYREGFNTWDWSKTEPEKRNLKCSKCGHTKSTRFRGPESVWICMECRGKEYTESKL